MEAGAPQGESEDPRIGRSPVIFLRAGTLVRFQVVSKLRSLCVSVLESDLDSRKQLESGVGTIAERLSRRTLSHSGIRRAQPLATATRLAVGLCFWGSSRVRSFKDVGALDGQDARRWWAKGQQRPITRDRVEANAEFGCRQEQSALLVSYRYFR